MVTIDELCEAWRINNAINLELLSACPEEAMDFKPGKGKTIRSNFVHLVSVRRMWIEDKMAKAALVPKLDWKTAGRSEIESALGVSCQLMQELFRLREQRFKPGAFPTIGFFAYCVAHEAHHRSQVEIALRMGGVELDEKFLYGLWGWSTK